MANPAAALLMSRTGRRVLLGAVAFVVAIVLGFGVLLVTVVGAAVGGTQQSAGDGRCYIDDPRVVSVDGYDVEKLSNAVTIMQAALSAGTGRDGQVLGVQAALGESGLVNIGHGDWETGGVTNPDGSPTTSVGLFQQQDNWGPREVRMDPAQSSALFFAALVKLEGWAGMEPSTAIHLVQINADPNHYTKFRADAEEIVRALIAACQSLRDNGGLQVGLDGWVSPVAPGTPMVSPYGPRDPFATPGGTTNPWHDGVDLPQGCWSPIMAAANGVVVSAGSNSGYGNAVVIEHVDQGARVTTLYAHMQWDSLTVRPGDTVKAGQVVGMEGTTGRSTGCHLHFEVEINGNTVDPAVFMAARGITW